MTAGDAHRCRRCDALPNVCKAAVVADRDRAWELVKDSESEPGRWWKEHYHRLAEHYMRAIENASRQQQRADRATSRAIKAEKALSRYERRAYCPACATDDACPAHSPPISPPVAAVPVHQQEEK